MNQVIVKTASSSTLKFRNTKAYRAITVKELNSLADNFPEANIMIIERIRETEYEDIKQSIINFEGSGKRVYFYIPDNDDITSGLADELIYNINMNEDSLFNQIKNDMGKNLHYDVTNNIEKIEDGMELFDEAFDSSFETAVNKLDEYKNKIELEEIELPTISNKDDIDLIEVEELEALEEQETKKENEVNIEESMETMDETRGSVKILDTDKIEVNNIELNELKKDNKLLKEFKQEAEVKLKEQDENIQRLRELSKAVEDEKEALVKLIGTYNKIDEYEEIEGIASETNTQEIQELQDLLSQKDKEIEELKNQQNSLSEQIKEADNSEEMEKLVADIANLTYLEESARKNLEHAEQAIKEYRQVIQLSMSQLYIQKIDVINKEDEIKTLSESIEQLQATIQGNNLQIEALQETLQENSVKLARTEMLEKQSENLKEINEGYKQTIESNTRRINELEELEAEAENRVELARNYIQGELDTKIRENTELLGTLELTKAQLTAKELQYTELVSATGVDSSGAVAIIENSKMIEEINKTLRDQIVNLKTEMDSQETTRKSLRESNMTLEEQNRQLKLSIKAMSASLTGTGRANSIAPINYTGKGMIIPVFGSGSYGITTTAMSIATKLSTKARVLYIDFDMVNPKADTWFKINPIVKNIPGYNPNNNKATGLGLFVDKQMPFILQNAQSIFLRAVSTKGGSVDYVSGFYSKPDTIKLISADFTSFFNYCGNNYTYTIVDFGRLGSSDVNDQIIKIVTDIAYRSVAVTTNDKFDVRTFRIKISDNQIDIKNIAWLLNLCNTTQLESTAKKAISPAQYSMMPLNMGAYGLKQDFNTDRMTRDKITHFIQNIVFREGA